MLEKFWEKLVDAIIPILVSSIIAFGANYQHNQYQTENNSVDIVAVQTQTNSNTKLIGELSTQIEVLGLTAQEQQRNMDKLDDSVEKNSDRIYLINSKIGHDKYGNLLEPPVHTGDIPTIK